MKPTKKPRLDLKREIVKALQQRDLARVEGGLAGHSQYSICWSDDPPCGIISREG